VRTARGTRMKFEGKTPSGIDTTSSANSLVTGLAFATYLDTEECALASGQPEWYGLVQGDDAFFIVSPELWNEMDGSTGLLIEYLAGLGLKFEVGACECNYTNPGPADFCSGFFWWYPDGTCLWGTKPMRAAMKSFLVDARLYPGEEATMMQIKATAQSLDGRTSHIPVLRTVVKKGLAAYPKKVKAKKLEQHAIAGVNIRKAPDFDYAARLYKLEVSDFERVERLIEEGGFPIQLNDPAVERMLAVEGVELAGYGDIVAPLQHTEMDAGMSFRTVVLPGEYQFGDFVVPGAEVRYA
jgi:hypothetical protein